MDDILLVDRAARVATVTLNRPAARNALSSELIRRLAEAAAALEEDDSVDVVVLTGAGKAFCAGLDLGELGTPGNALATGVVPREPGRRGPFPAMTKPVIGAVNGPAVTGGLELALACDFLVASERARFADTHARLGIQPTWGLSVLLPEAVGLRRAREMSTTGNFVDAATALEWGLVNHVVRHDELLERTLELAAAVTTCDQRAVRRLLSTYREGALVSGSEAWAVELRAAAEFLGGGGIDADDVARRRAGVIERGRSQV